MTAERGPLLEQLEEKGRRLSVIGSRRGRLHDAIGKGEVRPTSWEDVLRIGRLRSRVFKSRLRINSEIEEADNEVVTEKQRLALQATFFPDELARRTREIAELTRMAYQGFIPEDEYSRKLAEYQVLKSDPEVALGQKILGERQKRMRRGQPDPLTERVLRKELLEPREIYVNEGIHEGFNAIAVNGQEVVFRDGLEWDFLAKLLEVNHQNRYRQDSPPISSLEINRELIRPDGHNRSVIELVGQINVRFDLAGGDLIERQGKAKGTKYRINGKVVKFVGPERSLLPKTSVPVHTPEKIVPIEDYARRSESRKKEEVEKHFANRKRKPINVRERIKGIFDSFEATGVTFPINAYKLWSGYYKNLEPNFQKDMLSRSGALKPEKGDDHHPNFTEVDTTVMLFTKAANEYLQARGWEGLRAIIEEEIAVRSEKIAETK